MELTIVPRGPFSLAAASRFLGSWEASAGRPEGPPGEERLAFTLDDGRGSVTVGLTQPAPAEVRVRVLAAAGEVDPETLRHQVTRVLSLDGDGDAWAAVGEQDPVIGELQRATDLLRPVLFATPFEAGSYFLIGHRVRMTQARAVMLRLCDALGPELAVDGRRQPCWPDAQTVLRVEPGPGLPPIKVERLRALAAAQLDGRLDAERLRAADPADALADLRKIPGVGPFTAEGILVRGAGTQDRVVPFEPRIRGCVARAYGLPGEPDDAELTRIAKAWTPFRTWAAVLVRSAAKA
jgi:DNA-3-methyladenine glycosylase II